ncbi:MULTISPECIES: amylo-alpha-1,6-glucosidase [unclassified Clostridium]|uniref:amylo-alpha-1,6-glucosidase n=1 Tax=unclassified Clostridium TaxID=2614128 RepID=UPI0002972D54|nr:MULTISPECIES: amylo-alpha-1,6-glucosidase [unclassified Clostridium]EKQ56597.1 MAG: glycogen debranching enzyme, putative [Clostridium sp. Maddingley MBC34-26]
MELTYRFGRGCWRTIKEGNEREWMIGNGLGGYSGQTIINSGFRSHHGYLIASLNPPVERYAILSKIQEKIAVDGREYDLACQEYYNHNTKNGYEYLQRFIFDSIPQYIYQVEDIKLKKTIAMEYGHNTVVICYEIENGNSESQITITPLFTYKEAGSKIETNDLKFATQLKGNILKLYPHKNNQITISFMASDGEFKNRILNESNNNLLFEENHYYEFEYRTGNEGLDNHYTPYDIVINLQPFETKKFYLKCTIEEIDEKDGFTITEEYKNRANELMKLSGYSDALALNLVKSADHFIVNRNSTRLKTVLAGFPWFVDWGRDTMIAFEGLTLATKRFKDAREILESFAQYVRNGLVPNVFADKGTQPFYNTVDASLWYVQAVYKYLQYTGNESDFKFIKDKIFDKLVEIINAYSNGTDFSIYMDEDCLIHAGSGLDQVTWMDVRVGELVVTPRHGKPVEINALWYNALCIMDWLCEKFDKDKGNYKDLAKKVKESFNKKFWNSDEQCLYDVVDDNDGKVRPNQILAVSLPFTMLDLERERKVVYKVYKELYSTYGIRSLSFLDEEYKGEYTGALMKRDLAYHMGTSWGFITGAFISAYCKVNNYSKEAVYRAKEMCEVFEDHMNDGCINGIAEVFDGDFTATSRGCYSQAWSVGEVLRAYTNDVLPFL